MVHTGSVLHVSKLLLWIENMAISKYCEVWNIDDIAMYNSYKKKKKKIQLWTTSTNQRFFFYDTTPQEILLF